MKGDRLQNHHVEPFILPSLCIHLLTHRLQHRQGCGWVALGQVNAGLAERERVLLRQLGSGFQPILLQEDEHPNGSHLGRPVRKVRLARRLLSLRQHGVCAGTIALGQFQAGEKDLGANEPVNHAIILPQQLQALFPMLFGGLQIVPFVMDAGQAKMGIPSIRLRMVAREL